MHFASPRRAAPSLFEQPFFMAVSMVVTVQGAKSWNITFSAAIRDQCFCGARSLISSNCSYHLLGDGRTAGRRVRIRSGKNLPVGLPRIEWLYFPAMLPHGSLRNEGDGLLDGRKDNSDKLLLPRATVHLLLGEYLHRLASTSSPGSSP